jgi:hypothetical protein
LVALTKDATEMAKTPDRQPCRTSGLLEPSVARKLLVGRKFESKFFGGDMGDRIRYAI